MMMLYTTSIVHHMEMMRRVDGRREPSFLLFVLNQIFSINLQKGIEFFPISSPAMDELTNWCFQINTFRIFYSNQVHATASSHFQNQRKFKKKRLETQQCAAHHRIQQQHTHKKKRIQKWLDIQYPDQRNPINEGCDCYYFSFHFVSLFYS